MFRIGILAVLISSLGSVGCSNSISPGPETYRIEDSFENGISSWTAHSLDDKVDTLPIDWHFVPSDEMASQGSRSAKLYMENLTDAAKIWLEQALEVTPNKTYSVVISFDLASADYGEVNLFELLANVLPRKPLTRDDVVSGVRNGDFPEGTYNGGVEGYVWLPKSLTREITTNRDGQLYFILGIWGTWEGARTYYFDNLRITVTEHP
ncbi:MAG: hypothetical protein JSV52_10975 [Candidatus Zixiibacteriota bacterium]|nr:MAG: hypothetical protein JSV52_10975 [candidate division Zixibacteria bacterium]